MNAINATEKFQTLARRNYETARKSPEGSGDGGISPRNGVYDSVLVSETGSQKGVRSKGLGRRGRRGRDYLRHQRKRSTGKKGAPPAVQWGKT